MTRCSPTVRLALVVLLLLPLSGWRGGRGVRFFARLPHLVYQRAHRREMESALRSISRQWSRVRPSNVMESWRAVRPGILATLFVAQGRISRPTGDYVSDVLQETGLGRVDNPVAKVNLAPLIGFAGSPWTLACYMIEGKGGTDFRRSKALLAEQPALMHELLDVLTESVITYLAAQHRAGAQALMVFDSWGGILPPAHFREFSLRHLARIAEGLDLGEGDARTPLIMFSKGANTHLPALADIGADALGLDWTISLAHARELTGDRVALQGNFDPTLLYANPEAIRAEVGRVLADYGRGHGHVFNLGHGITPGVPPEHLGALVSAVHELSAPYHG